MQENNREEILAEIVAAISRISGHAREAIHEDLHLLNDLKLDSLAIYELVVDLEDRYGMQISNDDAEKLDTVADAVAYIHDRLRTA